MKNSDLNRVLFSPLTGFGVLTKSVELSENPSGAERGGKKMIEK